MSGRSSGNDLYTMKATRGGVLEHFDAIVDNFRIMDDLDVDFVADDSMPFMKAVSGEAGDGRLFLRFGVHGMEAADVSDTGSYADEVHDDDPIPDRNYVDGISALYHELERCCGLAKAKARREAAGTVSISCSAEDKAVISRWAARYGVGELEALHMVALHMLIEERYSEDRSLLGDE